METKKEQESLYLYQTKQISRQKGIRRQSLYNDKGVNSAREYNNFKYICTQRESTQIHKGNIIRTKERDRPQYKNTQRKHSSPINMHKLKIKGWKKIFHANGNQKRAEVAIFISDKIDFKTENVRRNKEGHHVMQRDQSSNKA